jgi:STE24 endopeptidase
MVHESSSFMARLQACALRRLLVLAALLATGLLFGGGPANAQGWPTAARAMLPPEVTTYFTPQEFMRGHVYAEGGYALFAAGLGVRLAALLALVLTPASAALRTWALGRAHGRTAAATALYASVVVLGLAMLNFPLRYYAGFVRGHAFQLSTQTRAAWFLDWGKALGLTLAVAIAVACLLTTLWRWARDQWAVWAWAISGLAVIVLVALTPLVLDPLFDPIHPLQDAALRARVLTLAQRAGLHADQVYVSEASQRTTAENAYFTGLGPTKRIVLYDTLVAHNDPDAVAAVVAHELGHWRHADIWKGLGLSLLGLAVCWWCAARVLTWAGRGRFHLAGPGDLAALPLVALVIFGLNLVSLPLQSAISRHFERAADATSLELTRDPAAFIRAEVQLARSDLADLAPPPALVALLYTHPPTVERIRMAEAFAARHERNGTPPPAPASGRAAGRG